MVHTAVLFVVAIRTVLPAVADPADGDAVGRVAQVLPGTLWGAFIAALAFIVHTYITLTDGRI